MDKLVRDFRCFDSLGRGISGLREFVDGCSRGVNNLWRGRGRGRSDNYSAIRSSDRAIIIVVRRDDEWELVAGRWRRCENVELVLEAGNHLVTPAQLPAERPVLLL